jgi:AcrR family transcriptional regulator
MAGYVPPHMVRTPWGNAEQLRERMLRPGPGIPREEVSQSQRERLFAATVASLAERGCEATSVADLLDLSGVSRSAFYQHFQDKEDCVLATFEELVSRAMEAASRELARDAPWRERARGALDALLEAVADQPAAARLCFSGVYTVGERGRLAVEKAMASFVDLAAETIGEAQGPGLPPEMVQGIVGGIRSVIQAHLREGSEDSLPDLGAGLLEWALSYALPSPPLRLARRRSRAPHGPPPSLFAYGQAERIIGALAASAGERGYPAVTIAEIAARASVSQATFYSHFVDKETALMAALDLAVSQMLGVALPAARRASDWPNAVRAGIGGLCAFYAAAPDFARLVAVEVYATDPATLGQRDDRTRVLLEPDGLVADKRQLVADAVLGAVWSVIHAQIVTAVGPQGLPQIAPLATYMALAPYLGMTKAVEVANGDGRAGPLPND